MRNKRTILARVIAVLCAIALLPVLPGVAQTEAASTTSLTITDLLFKGASVSYGENERTFDASNALKFMYGDMANSDMSFQHGWITAIKEIPAALKNAKFLTTGADFNLPTANGATGNYLEFTVNKPVIVLGMYEGDAPNSNLVKNDGWNALTKADDIFATYAYMRGDKTAYYTYMFYKEFPAGKVTIPYSGVDAWADGGGFAVVATDEIGSDVPTTNPTPAITNLKYKGNAVTIAENEQTFDASNALAFMYGDIENASMSFQHGWFTAIKNIPAALKGAKFMTTGADFNVASDGNYLEFTVDMPVVVVGMYEGPAPTTNLVTKDGWTTYSNGDDEFTKLAYMRGDKTNYYTYMFYKEFPAGTVTIPYSGVSAWANGGGFAIAAKSALSGGDEVEVVGNVTNLKYNGKDGTGAKIGKNLQDGKNTNSTANWTLKYDLITGSKYEGAWYIQLPGGDRQFTDEVDDYVQFDIDGPATVFIGTNYNQVPRWEAAGWEFTTAGDNWGAEGKGAYYSYQYYKHFDEACTVTIPSPGFALNYIFSTIVVFNDESYKGYKRPECDPMIMPAKDNAKAIVSITADDGYYEANNWMDEMYQKYGLEGTIVMQTTNAEENLEDFQALVEKGYSDITSHSYTHKYLTEGETFSDSVYKKEIIDSKKALQEYFPTVDVITYAPAGNTMTAEGLEYVKENYFAMRKGLRGINNINPTENEWYNLFIYGILDVTTDAQRQKWVDDAIANGQWLIEMWHSIYDYNPEVYQAISKADAEPHYQYLAEKQQAGDIWVAKFTDAVKYIRERQVSKVTNTDNGDGTYTLSVDYADTALPKDIFNYPLTVKAYVTEGWAYANVTQNGVSESVEVKEDEDGFYILTNIVPNVPATVEKYESPYELIEALEISYSGELNQVATMNPIEFSVATTPAEGIDPNTVAWYVNDLRRATGLTFTFTPDAAGTFDVYAKVSDNTAVVSDTVTVTITRMDPVVTWPTVKTVTIGKKPANVLVGGSGEGTFTISGDETPLTLADNGTTRQIIFTPTDSGKYNTLTKDVVLSVVESVAVTEDTVVLDDKFDTYGAVGTKITTANSKYNTVSETGNGLVIAADPTNTNNLVAKWDAGDSVTSATNVVLGHSADNTKPLLVTGRMYFDGTLASNKVTTAIGSSTVTWTHSDGRWRPNGSGWASSATGALKKTTWLDYALAMMPVEGTTNKQIHTYSWKQGNGSGEFTEGVNCAGTQYSIARNANNTFSWKYSMLSGETLYMDDIRIVNPGDFIISAKDATGVTGTTLNLVLNHPIRPATLTKDSVAVYKYDAATKEIGAAVKVTAASNTVTTTTATLTLGEALSADQAYIVVFEDSILDVLGQSVANPVIFNVQSSVDPKPDPEPEYDAGDINKDGGINALDRATLARYFAKWEAYTDLDTSTADTNGDGSVNVLDRAVLARYIAKWSGYETIPLK